MGDFISSVLYPIEWVVAWVMYGFHEAFSALGMPEDSGWTWGLSIVGLVIVIRAVLIPLFVKQIHASRRMQMISPEIQKIQAKYKGKTDPESRQKMTQETMALYRTAGTNPFSSCLPILAQSPIFFGLFRVLNGLQGIAEGTRDPIGPITRSVASQAEKAQVFGAQLSDKFVAADSASTRIVTIVLIVLMSATTFTTQRQLMTKNMPASALDNPFARQQKVLMYVLPLVFAISGINFPIGVLIYWFVTNLWTMCQQFYVIRNMPAPGSVAEKALHERRSRRGQPPPKMPDVGGVLDRVDDAPATDAPRVSGQRQQPKKNKRKGAKPPAAGAKNPTTGPQSAPGSDATLNDTPSDKPSSTGPADAAGPAPTTAGASGQSTAGPGSTGNTPGTRQPGKKRRRGTSRPDSDPTQSPRDDNPTI